jgi:outer membrane protein TolC
LGLAVTFPAFDLSSLHARKEIEVHEERAQTARYEKTLDDLNLQLEKAEAQLRAARQIAGNTPTQLQAAQAAEQQATARYRSGLSSILEVADAQRLLTQAQIDDSLAKLNVWRALLAGAAARGNLESFLTQTGR